MAQFIYDDFVSDNIPGCHLTNSAQVKAFITASMKTPITILDVFLISIVYKKEVLLEWHVAAEINGESRMIFMPVWCPSNMEQAHLEITKHQEAFKDDRYPKCPLIPRDFILINNQYPCHIIQGEDEELYIKRIKIWASQTIVEQFAATVNQNDAVAVPVLITMHNSFYKNLYDIGWLIITDDRPQLLSIDAVHPSWGLAVVDNYEPLPDNFSFSLNSVDYTIFEDEENGKFLAKNLS